ncbi:lysine N(6)-hydroxylase/L-ornithine N(5)-oxygenase family protein [Zhihengliuella halotolerans]|uniref:L-lysine N6-monooxygenase MbtG n=1 Tax=Zhihengliuella halotolerans TaxID=370736 RepID=A0A4Q8AFC6_9MICC|nr:SidA/IucD/PvdA family monooxygenase [Zhihengliuella halotolerans]RZU62319.1 lysine N6-hydroxylase [Zhihengliuella halotolerans]
MIPSPTTDLTDGQVFDAVGIGAGPFNLGFAALATGAPDLRVAVFDAADDFTWHPGMMLPGTHLQVPFMADLVTLADPSNEHSFLNYLKASGRLYPFYIRENFYALRREYSDYLRWAAHRLDSVRFGHTVTDVTHEDGSYRVTVQTPAGARTVRALNLVLGTGTQPWVPDTVDPVALATGDAFHTSEYAHRRTQLADRHRIAVVGSGQSAAEVVADLLETWVDTPHEETGEPRELVWMTRSPRFFPLEYTKLTLEMTSPEYIDHFHGLPTSRRDALGAAQKGLYKGINADLIDHIHELMYMRDVESAPGRVRLMAATSLDTLTSRVDGLRLNVHNDDDGGAHALDVDTTVLATGYGYREPGFLSGIEDRIRRLPDGRFDVDREYSIGVHSDVLVQNAELHTHGFTAPDLGMGAYRNSVIINRIASREVYPVEQRIAYQEFGSSKPAAGTTHQYDDAAPATAPAETGAAPRQEATR